MTVNLNEAISKIKAAGASNTRVVTLTDGKCSVEVRDGSGWQQILTGVTQRMAEDIIGQATNRVICG